MIYLHAQQTITIKKEFKKFGKKWNKINISQKVPFIYKYKDNYSGWYCSADENFIPEIELKSII